MNYVRFIIYQFILFTGLFLINIPLDKYISKPFNHVDLVAICISFPVIIIVYSLVNKVYRRFESIRLRYKILISIPIVLISILFIGFIMQLFFKVSY